MEIKHINGTTLYVAEGVTTIRGALEQAVSRSANLDGAYLARANLVGANLYGANLARANLVGANLYGANLEYWSDYDEHYLRGHAVGAERAELRAA